MDDYSRIQLIKTRHELLATLDASICSQINGMHEHGAMSLEKFLDILEQKGRGCFQELCQLLEIKSPQLLLLLVGWEERGSAVKQLGKRKVASASSAWCQIRYNKVFLSRMLDVQKLLEPLIQQKIINFKEAREIRQQETSLEKIETLINILERKPPHYFDAFLDSLSTHYPHVFLKIVSIANTTDSD